MKANPFTKAEDKSLTQDVIEYLKNPQTTRLNNLYNTFSRRGSRSGTIGPLITLGNNQTSGTSIEVELDISKPLTLENIIKVKNRRIS